MKRRGPITLYSALATAALALVLGLVAWGQERSALMATAEREMLLLMSLRTSALSAIVASGESEVRTWSRHGPIRAGLIAFAEAWRDIGPDAAAGLRRRYLEENPFPESERYRLEDPGDGTTYAALHADVQPAVRRFLETMGYYDIFLVDPEGNLLYTYSKEEDFGTNLLDGAWSDTGLGEVVREANTSADPEAVAFSDFAPYAPSGDAPAAFFAGPVMDEDGSRLGVLALQIPADVIDRVMQSGEGMGETGEAFAVGPDLQMRSDSRFSETSTQLTTAVDTEPVRRALAGESGVMRARDYRDEEVIAAYGPFDLTGVPWAIIAKIDVAEVVAPLGGLVTRLLLAGLAAVAAVTLAAAAGLFDTVSVLQRSPLGDDHT